MSETVIPSVRQELERKTIELLEAEVSRCENMRLSRGDLHYMATQLWTLTSGLVGSDVSAMCTAVAEEYPQRRKMSRQFLGKGKLLTVAWLPDSSGYLIYTQDASTHEKVVLAKKTTEIGLREAELKNIFSTLPAKGFIEVN